MKPTDITGPLEDFQHTQFSKDEIKKLMQTINNASTERKLTEALFDDTLERWWPALEQRLKQVVPPLTGPPKAKRTVEEMTEEILILVQDIASVFAAASDLRARIWLG